MARKGSMYKAMWERQLAEEQQKLAGIANEEDGITSGEEEEGGAMASATAAAAVV